MAAVDAVPWPLLHPGLVCRARDISACPAEGQGIDMDDADAAQVALAVRAPAAILAMDDTGALQRTWHCPGLSAPPCCAQRPRLNWRNLTLAVPAQGMGGVMVTPATIGCGADSSPSWWQCVCILPTFSMNRVL